MDNAAIQCFSAFERKGEHVHSQLGQKLISWIPVETARPLSSISEISSVVTRGGYITFFSFTSTLFHFTGLSLNSDKTLQGIEGIFK